MSKVLRNTVLALGLLAPATGQAQANLEPFVQLSVSAGSSGYVNVTIGICHNRQITNYYYTYGGNNFMSYMWGQATAPQSWCTAIYPDPSYEEWTGEVPELCGFNWFNIQVVDAASYGGGDGGGWTGCLEPAAPFASTTVAFADAECAPVGLAWQPRIASLSGGGALRRDS